MKTVQMKVKKSLARQWAEDAGKYLVGRTIKSVGYMTKQECLDNMWDKSGLIIELNDGTYLYPMSDDEGNSPGAFGTTLENLPVIPVIRVSDL